MKVTLTRLQIEEAYGAATTRLETIEADPESLGDDETIELLRHMDNLLSSAYYAKTRSEIELTAHEANWLIGELESRYDLAIDSYHAGGEKRELALANSIRGAIRKLRNEP